MVANYLIVNLSDLVHVDGMGPHTYSPLKAEVQLFWISPQTLLKHAIGYVAFSK